MTENSKELKFAEIRRREEFTEALRGKDIFRIKEFCRDPGIRWVILQTLVNFNSGIASAPICNIVAQRGIDEAVQAIGPDKRSQIYVTDQVLYYALATVGCASNRDLPVTRVPHQQSVLKIMSMDNYNEIARAIANFYTGAAPNYIDGYICGVDVTDLPVVAGVLVQVSEGRIELSGQALIMIPKCSQRQVITQDAIRALLQRILSLGFLGRQHEQVAAMFGLLLSITEPIND